MNLKDQLNRVLGRVKELAAAAAERDLTDEEIEEAETLRKDADDLRAKIERAEKAAKTIASLADAPVDEHVIDDTDVDTEPGAVRTAAKAFGEAFVKSAEYERFRKEFPSGVGQGTPVNIGRVKVGSMHDWIAHRKATLDLEVGRVQPVRMPMVDLVDRDRLTLLDLISRGRTGGSFEYVQVVGVNRNAAIVAEGGEKPLSDIETALADAKVFTYADGYDVTNQLLSDAPAFASYMDPELRYSLDNVVEEYILNGTGVNGQPRGILNTTGVQEQAFDTDMVTTVRKAITRVTRLGGQVTAVLMSPEDDEAWDLLKDGNDRYYGQGPFGSGPGTAWGRPRAVSERLSPGEVILGDFRQIALLDREGVSIQAFNQHADYARRNMVYVRAELRAAQAIWRPNRLVVATVANGG